MTLVPGRQRLAAAWTQRATYAAAALVFAVAGWLLAGVQDSVLPAATTAAALLGALALGIVGARSRTLTGPLVVLGVPLLLSLAAAMQPITRIFGDWTPEKIGVIALIVLAPIAGVGLAMLIAPGRTPEVGRGTDATPHALRLVTICVLMSIIASVVYASEWASVGGPPLLSASIDDARFGVQVGLVHVLTEGLPLALLIAAWARIGRPQSFTAGQRRVLEAIIIIAPIILALGGGRALVIVPLVGAFVVAARYVSQRVARRLLFVIPVAVLLFSSAIFVLRAAQNAPTGPVGTVLYNDSGAKSTPLQSAYGSLSIGLGQQLRVVSELRDAHVSTPPFTTSLWFVHKFVRRAIDPQVVTGANAGGWLTATYAGPLLLDFGLFAATLFGLGLGLGAQMLYRAFARGRSVTVIWLYAYLAGPIAFAFYVNVFLQFIYPILDLIVLLTLSRLLIKPAPQPVEDGYAAALR